jgi:hypothetical protein
MKRIGSFVVVASLFLTACTVTTGTGKSPTGGAGSTGSGSNGGGGGGGGGGLGNGTGGGGGVGSGGAGGGSGGVGSGGGSGGGAGGGGVGSGGGGGSLDAALVGTWWAGRGGTSSPYDPSTGSWGTPNGGGLGFVFRDDGSYTKVAMDYTSTGDCTTGWSAFEDGTEVSDGSTVQLTPASGHIEFSSSCAPSEDSDKPIAVQDDTLSYAVAPYSQDPTRTGLTLTAQDGSSSEFLEIN